MKLKLSKWKAFILLSIKQCKTSFYENPNANQGRSQTT